MAKKVVVLNQAHGIEFGFEERTVVVSETMALADAQHISTTYPGVYCMVVDEPAAAPDTDKTKAPKQA